MANAENTSRPGPGENELFWGGEWWWLEYALPISAQIKQKQETQYTRSLEQT